MQVLRHENQLEIILFQPEAYLFKKSLEEIVQNYRTDPEDLPDTVRELWFSAGSSMDSEDLEIWLDHLREFRGENSVLAQKLVSHLAEENSWPAVLSVSLSEADTLLTIMNDQRLYLAATYDVGEVEMNEYWEELVASPEKQVVVQIHFLAWLIELIIMRLEGNEFT